MRIGMLGPLEAHADSGVPLPVSGARLRRLLIVLALDAGRVVSTRRLIDSLWGDEPPAGAANALQALVSRLRRAVPDAPVETHPTGYRLAVPPETVDAHRFERLVTAARALRPHEPARSLALLDEALDLWRGPALADATDAEFARAPVARLQELRLAAAEERIEAQLTLGADTELVPELRALVAAHPVRERLTGQLIRALRAAGRDAEALAAYERLRGTLAETLGADPSPDLATLHLELLLGTPATAPAPATDTAAPATTAAATAATATAWPAGVATGVGADGPVRTNLPARLTSFVGREKAVDRLGELVGESRLTTLTGPGGAGKTRLAVESARHLVDRVPDGVWLVELAPVTDPAELPQSVLTVLGLREHALVVGARSRPQPELSDPVERLVRALAHRNALLILDNCEHLVGTAAELVDRLLAACPALRVLCTSREPLGITGEALWPVGSLDLPPEDADPATALAYPAVRLLADRAGAVRPDFAVDGGTVADVVRICRALDGMPLAIELAAARLRTLTAGQLAARLDDRFRLLTAGSRTARPRHQTLRAVVDWSWDLLDPSERALWRRLAVFTGSASLASVERVCAGPGLDRADVFDRICALVDKSLVLVVGDGSEPRYRMLETIRAYGLDRLAEAGETEPLRRAHANEFLDLAEAADTRLRGAEQLPWIGRLDAEHDNLHAALRWVISVGDAGTSVRYAAALGWYWWLRGHRNEGTELVEQVLDLPGVAQTPAVTRAVAYAAAAMNVLAARADLTLGAVWMALAARLARGHEQAHPVLRLVAPLSLILEHGRDREALAELSARFHDHDPWVRAVAHAFHAGTEINLGLPDDGARANVVAALAAFREAGDRWGTTLALTSVAGLAARHGNHAEAAAGYRAALAEVRPLGASEDVPEIQVMLALQLWQLGEREEALATLTEAEEIAVRLGSASCQAAVSYQWAELLRAMGDWAAARQRLRRTTELAAGVPVPPQWHAVTATAMGCVEAAGGDVAAARVEHDRALALALGAHDAPVVAVALVGFADLAVCSGRPAAAATLLGAASAVRGGSDCSVLDERRVGTAARDALGEPGFAEAYARGAGTTLPTVPELIRRTIDG